MSTSTQTYAGFAPAPIEDLPRLACIGSVGKIGDAKITAKGIYAMIQVELHPSESGKKGFLNFLFRPEWLEPGFNPAALKELDNGKAMSTVYRMNVAAPRELSVLAGIAGSDENFLQLAGKIMSIEGDKTPEAVQAALVEFVNETNPTVGYILRQKTQKNEETGEYEKQDGYEVGSFFYDTAEARKNLEKQVAAGKLVAGFEL